MGCEMCGRSNCTRSFHSLEEQEEFDKVADGVKARAKNVLIGRVRRLTCIDNENDAYIKMDDVISEIEDVLW